MYYLFDFIRACCHILNCRKGNTALPSTHTQPHRLCLVGNLLFTSGTLGTRPDENDTDVLPYVGKVGSDLPIEEGYAPARLMAIDHLAMMKAVLGDLDRVKRIVKMIGYVSCAPGFTAPHLVLNGASDLFVELWAEQSGKHARAALTQHELGLDAPVEADLAVELHA